MASCAAGKILYLYTCKQQKLYIIIHIIDLCAENCQVNLEIFKVVNLQWFALQQLRTHVYNDNDNK